MKFSVCTDAVLNKLPTVEALQKVRECGLDAVEFWSWWDKNLPMIAAEAQRLRIEIVAFCTRFVSLTDPAQRDAYLAGLRESIEAARTCGTRILISQTGADTGAPRDLQRASLVAGLRAAVPLLDAADVTLAIEPLNVHYDHKGYFLSRSDEAFDIVAEVASPHVKVLYDIYHQQITEGDLINTLTANLPALAHVHVAGHPGRHELDDGEINAPHIFAALDRAGYEGYIGLEYFPLREPSEGLRAIASNTFLSPAGHG